MNRLVGTISFALLLTACALAPEQPDAQGSIEKLNLWEAGAGGYAHYRIPAIACTAKGSLLAFCEARKETGGDWGAIDIMMRRSTDGDRTWDAPRIVARVEGAVEKNPVAVAQNLGAEGQITYNNPVPNVDRQTGAVHFLFCVEYARAFYMRSEDDGATFSAPVEITSAFEEFRPDYDWKGDRNRAGARNPARKRAARRSHMDVHGAPAGIPIGPPPPA